MLQFDQESEPPRRSAHGLSGTADTPGSVLDVLAREIEDMQRQQSETVAHIIERMKSFEEDQARTAQKSASRQYVLLDEAGDEPWDNDTAEELMRSYEADKAEPKRVSGGMSYSQQAWIGERFNTITEKITQALEDLKPNRTMALLEERLDAFQGTINSALKDVVRREDLEGMRLIEVHVNDLSDKLDELERHVSRIDGIEADVRSVMEQVSDTRIAKLLDYDSRFAADLEAVARRAVEEVHTRIVPDEAQAQADSRRHEELRTLIEASIKDRREADLQAASLVTGLSGRVSAQSDRYDELKGLLEQAIQEQRQNEQTAFGMLDTLQQALVTVLDRMDALEHQHYAVAPLAEEPAAAHSEPYTGEHRPPASETGGDPAPYTFRDTRFDSTFGTKDAPGDTLPDESPSTFAEPGLQDPAEAGDDAESALDRLRRDFVADARRAKMKAAADRAEALADKTEPQKSDSVVAQARATLTQARTAAQPAPASGRIFGMSTKLLAGVLALIIAINGGLLLADRTSTRAPETPEIARPATAAPHDVTGAVPQAPAVRGSAAPSAPAGVPGTGPRSDFGRAPHAGASPYGFHDDVLNPPEVETMGSAAAETPHGMTIAKTDGAPPDEAIASLYEQQVLASLSGKLGMVAAGQSAGAMLPETSGRIDASYPEPEVNPRDEGAERASALDLPPATVGPLSLRLAAAGGDASAEFEVGARLAEGKGTGQDYAEALRWYQRAAAKGFAQAQYRVGTLYERGLGVAKDLERAKVWYQRAAENGNVKSMHNLAVLISGSEQSEPNFAAAAPWFTKAAEYGLADSQYNLGVLVENGLGMKADRVAAYKWYALAAKNGDQDAIQRRDALKSSLSGTEVKSGESMAAAFKARAAAPLANDPRAAGEDWKKRVNNDTNT